MAKVLADEIHLLYKKEKGYVKGVNARAYRSMELLIMLPSKSIHGEVRST